MTEPTRTRGPGTPPEQPGGKKEASGVDTEKFKKLMAPVENISETDTESQSKKKKKKSEGGEEEEELVQPEEEPTPPPENAAPFPQTGPLGVQQPTTTPRAAPATPAPPTKAVSPAPEEEELWDEEAFNLNFSSVLEQTEPVLQEEPISPQIPVPQIAPEESVAPTERKAPKPQPLAPGMPAEIKKVKKPSAAKAQAPQAPEAKTEKPEPLEEQPTRAKKEKARLAKEAQPTQGAPAPERKEEKETFFKKFAEKKPLHAEEQKEQQVKEVAPAPPLPPKEGVAPLEKERKAEKKIERGAPPLEVGISPAPPQVTPLPSAPVGPPAPYAYLHPEVLEIFERMAGVMTVMTASGITETTVTLNVPQSSRFFGAEITVREFSTAPKAFNIELAGSDAAVALFSQNANDLMAAFKAGGYNFRVNRLDTTLLSAERPLFKRKESISGGGGEGKAPGGNR